MKKFILIVMLVAVAVGASAQGWRAKRKAKQAQEDTLPVMAVFKAASEEKFILYFNGEKVNEDPMMEVAVKRAKLNEPYNVRVVLKSPRVVANMNFRSVTLTKQGEEYVVKRNVKRDNVEILTSEEYRKLTEKSSKNSVKSMLPNYREIRGDSLKVGTMKLDTVQRIVSPMEVEKIKRDTIIINN